MHVPTVPLMLQVCITAQLDAWTTGAAGCLHALCTSLHYGTGSP